MPLNSPVLFRERFFRYTRGGIVAVCATTPLIAVLQGYYYLSEFRRNHRDAPFPSMPCSGVVVVLPQESERSSTAGVLASSRSWFSSFPLLSQQKDPNPLRLLVVGDSLAAGVGVTKSGTPVLPEAIAKTLSRSLGGRAVYWTCMGEPGLSSPQIVKELLLASDGNLSEGRQIDVMKELKDWWQERRDQQQQQEEEEEEEEPEGRQFTEVENVGPEVPAKLRAWWQKVRTGAKKDIDNIRNDIENIKKRLRISEKIPEPAVVLPRRRNTVVPDLVAEYDVAVVITGFNDLKNLIFPLPPDPDEGGTTATKQDGAEEDGLTSSQWLEKDLLSIVRALRGKMRNYGFSDDSSEKTEDEEKSSGDKPTVSNDTEQSASSLNETEQVDSAAASQTRRHHPMVVFPATPLFAEKIYPLEWFAAPGVKIMEYQKKRLAERYPAPVLFLEAPDDKTIKDFTNKRGPLWEAKSREEVLFELTNKARLEQLEKMMKEYYDRWTVDVEEEEATYTYDAFGPDLKGPMQNLEHSRSPLISVDRVHPSDEGYELWGRHIASAIVKEWDRVDNSSNR